MFTLTNCSPGRSPEFFGRSSSPVSGPILICLNTLTPSIRWGTILRRVEPEPERLIMYGVEAEVAGLDWTWVSKQLHDAPAYWLATPTDGHPHPRPVWGIWDRETLYLSIGSPQLNSATLLQAPVTAHLGSITDVVIVEGAVAGSTEDPEVLASYNSKYDWDYTIEQYGPFTTVVPSKVLAWRSGGWAGRDGFQQTGRWRLEHDDNN